MNGYGNSVFLRTAFEVSSGVPPVNTVAPAITGTAQEGETVTCSTGSWTGTPTITFAYQWKRNGSNIGSATNSTYVLVTADVSQSITCQVTATNGFGSASATSNTITPIAAVDPDAQAFITAAAITDPTQQAAINTLVVDLKGYSIWSKLGALYPFVGSTASQHKFNLKNPLDTDGAFRLTFTGGWTHTSTGAKPNGVNAFADTYYTAFSLMGTNQQIGYYIGENLAGNYIDIGSNGGTDMGLWTRRTTDQFRFDFPQSTVPAVFTNTDSRGNYLVFNNSTLGRGVYKNGSSIYSSAFQNVNIFDNNTRKILLSKNVYTFFSPRELRLVAFGTGFTSLTEVTNYTTAIQAFQTTLGRQV